MKARPNNEWSRYYRLAHGSIDVLHAGFVTHHYPRHAHDYLVVGLVPRGAQSCSYRGARHVTPEGQLFLVNPEEPHTGEAATHDGYLLQTLYPRTGFLTHLAQDISGRASLPFFKVAVFKDPTLASLLARCHASIAVQNSKAECEGRVLEALACLIERYAYPRPLTRLAGREPTAVRRARAYIEQSFAEDISLSELAALVSFSPYYFARVFQRAVGLPPHAYLEGVRVRKARELLDTGEPPGSVALMVGYADQSHFTHRFKCFVGVTPCEYARSKI